MRLFIAILFDENSKDLLFRTAQKLKSNSKDGSFTDRDNLHLTVSFIGETKRLEEVHQAMNHAVARINPSRFVLSIRGLGKFKRNEGDIYWVGVEKEMTLWRLQKELVKELKGVGFFDVDDREYKPHLTLARRVRVNDNFSLQEMEAFIEPMELEVSKISLMKSERLQGKLTYTEIYHLSID